MDWEDALKIFGFLITLTGLLITFKKWREETLRRSDVLAWAIKCIDCMETCVIACDVLHVPELAETAAKRAADAAFTSASLVEQGRLFFRNIPSGDFGKTKREAYRGLRPLVLDPLVAIHKVALELVRNPAANRAELKAVALDYLKLFVSLIQQEVGRERTASAATTQGGSSFDLDVAIAQLKQRG